MMFKMFVGHNGVFADTNENDHMGDFVLEFLATEH